MILITGGARSGKSQFAETLAKGIGEKILYLATAQAMDQEMEARIQKHQLRRPKAWGTYEGFLHLEEVIRQEERNYDGFLLDCLTLWATNQLFYISNEKEITQEKEFLVYENRIYEEFQKVLEACNASKKDAIFVTNELGMGVVPETLLGRKFRDLAGGLNQMAAKTAREVYLVVTGLPLKVK